MGRRKKKIDTSDNEQPVYCTEKVSKHCIFGVNNGCYLCNYLLLINHSRGCSYKECYKFKEGKPILAK